jgi:benzoyl-CoA reductase/2-hydroxyglutaryl-CoA dehydratase subunit BcrC/BadD/HgdB
MGAEQKQERSKKSMETARKAGYFGKKMLKKAQAAYQDGRPVGWSMLTWYEGELIAQAMGIELVFPENYGALCAALRCAEPYLEQCDSDGFPTTLCGYARNCLGYASLLAGNDMIPPPDAPKGGMPTPTLLIGSGAVCDGRFKWFQALKRYLDVPVWTLERPQTGIQEFYLPDHKENAVRMITSHLREFVTFLEHTLGWKMNWDRLEEMVSQTLKTLDLAHQVDLLRKAIPSPMVSQDFYAIMIPHLYLPYDPEAYDFCKEVFAEVKQRVDKGIAAVPNEQYRMMFAELPPWHSLGFFDKLAERYGIAFVYESWGYHAPVPIPQEQLVDVTDPLEIIARLTYGKYTEYYGIAKNYDFTTSRTSPYAMAATEYRADGMMLHPLFSCRPATYDLLAHKNILAQRFKVPSVIIEGDIVDLRVFNEAEALSRMEAFVETMEDYRQQREMDNLTG